ncbi:hypothetical protein AMAG_12622 [Allomyces macrogynus ATCC 38327]|uniref:BTB domain-containing protein n=1 Tax=Allomyces macrogynus (strain ATCC 38327) TaxID=578462 RepID=A0A0L0SZQ5_ALLM3|nr:hypothetical protein AMAG_12622 [Allomyces macrogynus ATCC 38327]|eukprot:KNE67905.1 hypothetical protein AMAG_12622 [Allomyces macrogynus ATCC 38327]
MVRPSTDSGLTAMSAPRKPSLAPSAATTAATNGAHSTAAASTTMNGPISRNGAPFASVGDLLWQHGYYSDVTLDFNDQAAMCATLGLEPRLHLHAAVLAQCAFFASQLRSLVTAARAPARGKPVPAARNVVIKMPGRSSALDLQAFYTALRLLYTKRFNAELAAANEDAPDLAVAVLGVCVELEWDEGVHECWQWLAKYCRPVVPRSRPRVGTASSLATAATTVRTEDLASEEEVEEEVDVHDGNSGGGNFSLLEKLATAYPTLRDLYDTEVAAAEEAAGRAGTEYQPPGTPQSAHLTLQPDGGEGVESVPDGGSGSNGTSSRRPSADAGSDGANVEVPVPVVPSAEELRGSLILDLGEKDENDPDRTEADLADESDDEEEDRLQARYGDDGVPESARVGSYLNLTTLAQLLLNAAQAYSVISTTDANPTAAASTMPHDASDDPDLAEYLALDRMVKLELEHNAHDLDTTNHVAVSGEALLGAMDQVLTDVAQLSIQYLRAADPRAPPPTAGTSGDVPLRLLALGRMATYLLKRATEHAILNGHRMLLVLQYVAKFEYLISTIAHGSVVMATPASMRPPGTDVTTHRQQVAHDLVHNLLPTVFVETYAFILELQVPSNTADRYLTSAQATAMAIRVLQLVSHPRWRASLRAYLCTADTPWDAYLALLMDEILDRRDRKELITALILTQRLGAEVARHHYPDLHVARRDRAGWIPRRLRRNTSQNSLRSGVSTTYAVSGALSSAVVAQHRGNAPPKGAGGRVHRRQSTYRKVLLRRHSVLTPDMQRQLEEMLELDAAAAAGRRSAEFGLSAPSTPASTVGPSPLASGDNGDGQADAGAAAAAASASASASIDQDDKVLGKAKHLQSSFSSGENYVTTESSSEGDELDDHVHERAPAIVEDLAKTAATVADSPEYARILAESHLTLPDLPTAVAPKSTAAPSALDHAPLHEIMAGRATLQRMAQERYLVALAAGATAAVVPRPSAASAVEPDREDPMTTASAAAPSPAPSTIGRWRRLRNPLRKSKSRETDS